MLVLTPDSTSTSTNTPVPAFISIQISMAIAMAMAIAITFAITIKTSLTNERTKPTYLFAQISKLGIVKSGLFLRQLGKCNGIIQIKDEIRQCLWDAGISINGHLSTGIFLRQETREGK